jgi:polyisoprenoid-binding protein YceI
MTTTTKTRTAIPTGTWRSDPVHSHVGFTVKHMVVATFRGGFDEFDVTLTGGEDASLRGEVDVGSVKVRDENLHAHLLSPEFFDAERHPRIGFVSSAIDRDGEEIVVEGELTLKGTTRTVEARGTITDPIAGLGGAERIGLDLETTVDRTDFGLDWNAPLPSGGVAVQNDVTLAVHLELVKED